MLEAYIFITPVEFVRAYAHKLPCPVPSVRDGSENMPGFERLEVIPKWKPALSSRINAYSGSGCQG